MSDSLKTRPVDEHRADIETLHEWSQQKLSPEDTKVLEELSAEAQTAREADHYTEQLGEKAIAGLNKLKRIQNHDN